MTSPSRAAIKWWELKEEMRQWRIKRSLLNPKTEMLTKEGVHRQERQMSHVIGNPGWTPEVEPLIGQPRGVFCKSAGGVRCLAQAGPDEINTAICRNCNDLKRAGKDKASFEAKQSQQAYTERTWRSYKNGNPATRKWP